MTEEQPLLSDISDTDMASREASNLVPPDGRTSGRGWGRVGKFVSGQNSYPVGVFFIIANEFCERFSYYGMRAILVVYLVDWLHFSSDLATAVYHTFIVLCYFSPLIGAVLADGYIGKYKTILYVSIMYAAGNILMAMTAFPPSFWLGPMISLLLIGLGTGGIKPCVSAFGGDQFTADQVRQLAQFFSIFYFAINLGSLLSTIMTPLLRANVFCFGTNCFPLAFGIPAILMVLALIAFVAGRNLYKKVPPTGNVIGQMVRAIWRAFTRYCKRREKRAHWLDHADDVFDAAFLDDVRCVLRVLFLFLPLPVFWALFDQQGSRWILQAREMDCYIFGGWQLPPELMQAINPILIILFIPLFEGVIYPALDHCKVPNRPLQRMVVGMLLASVSFVGAGLLQLHVASSIDISLPSSQSAVQLLNTADCPITAALPFTNTTLASMQETPKMLVAPGNYTGRFVVMTTGNQSCDSIREADVEITADFQGGKSYFVVMGNNNGVLETKLVAMPSYKPRDGTAFIGVLYVSGTLSGDNTLLIEGARGRAPLTFGEVKLFLPTQFLKISPGKHKVQLGDRSNDIQTDNGAIYLITIATRSSQLVVTSHQAVPGNTVSVLWQIPQYALITAGEILFSISGLSFAYSQAPVSMKSVLQASWLLTVAVGNLLDAIITGAGTIPDQAVEFFVFASLMAVTTGIFAIMTCFYEYRTHQPSSREDSDTLNLVVQQSTTLNDSMDKLPEVSPVATETQQESSGGVETDVGEEMKDE